MSKAKPLLTATNEAMAERAKQIYVARRKRDRIFGDLVTFGEPAWDILLDLYVARHAHSEVTITSASIASGVPQSTALRWIDSLTDRGLVLRQPHKWDKRCFLLSLTPCAIEMMERWLGELP